MSKISTDMSGAPATWSIRPVTFRESADTAVGITRVGPSLEEVSGDTLEEETGVSLEEDSTDELLAGAVTASEISYFCPLIVNVSL